MFTRHSFEPPQKVKMAVSAGRLYRSVTPTRQKNLKKLEENNFTLPQSNKSSDVILGISYVSYVVYAPKLVLHAVVSLLD
jgi:hypothetical protein